MIRLCSIQPVAERGGSDQALLRMLRSLPVDFECHVVVPSDPPLRAEYEAAAKLPVDEATKGSPLVSTRRPLPRYVTVGGTSGREPSAASVVASLNERGFWLAPLGYNTHPYRGPASDAVAPGDFSQAHVGDVFDTSPYPDPALMGISVETYIRNMGVLICALGLP
jgi:hypothetical protein